MVSCGSFVAGMFMDIMDTTIINVALPTLGQNFGVGDGTFEWVVTGYMLSLAIWIPASGWIGDRFGTKKTFLFALIVFTIGSALCGAAWNIQSLIGFRLLQGVGGGMVTPVGTSMLFRAFPPSERAHASAVLTIPTAIAPALGPVLGGWLVDNASWRWISTSTFLLVLRHSSSRWCSCANTPSQRRGDSTSGALSVPAGDWR